MAETDYHRDLMTWLIQMLEYFFRQQQDVYVSGNLLVFYEQGNKRKHVSPDVFVVRGVNKHKRMNYLIWQEGKAPQVVIELTSKTTRKEDQDTKLELYQNTLKVDEYFLFDPFGDYLDPPLQGYRLRKGVYHPIRPLHHRLPSRHLGLHLERDGQYLRFWDPATSSWLLTESERAECEAQRANDAEQRANDAEQRANDEARRANDEARRANDETQRANALAAELRRLRGEE